MKTATILSLFLINGIINAQNIELSVLNKDSKPLPYAYILVDKKPVTVTDTLGKAFIPIIKLNNKDTISVSYLGAQPNWIVFDDSLKIKKQHCFYLDESGYTLNEVVVKYQDIENLFRKSIKSYPVLNYNSEMSAKFNFKINYDSINTYEKTINGTLLAINNIKFEPRRFNWFDPPIKFFSENDTNNLTQSLSNNTHNALMLANISLNYWQIKNPRAKPFFSYLGEKDNFNVFRISYPKSLFQKFYYQIILYIEKESKNLKHVEVNAYNDEPISSPLNNYQYMFNLIYDCELYAHKKPKRPLIYFPINIDYTLQAIDYSTINLRIFDQKLNP